MVLTLTDIRADGAAELLEVNLLQVRLMKLKQNHRLVIIILHQPFNDFVLNFEFHL